MSNNSVGMFGRSPSRRSRRAFTLVEVLIVLGIIALLATILLAVLSKVREAGRRTTCMNNLGSIAKAVLLYVNNNDGYFPFAAARMSDDARVSGQGSPEGHMSADWIFWQCGQSDKLPSNSVPPPSPQGNGLVIDDVDKGGIGVYLGGCNDQSISGLQMLRCPSDLRLFNSTMATSPPGTGYPPGMNGQSPYSFSYVLNALMSSANYSTNAAAGLPQYGFIAKTLARVKDPGTKILVYEEDPRTIDDGNGLLIPNGSRTDMLAIRHNGPEIDDPSSNGLSDLRDPVMASYTPPSGATPGQLSISNPGSQGNAAFCDGHAEVIQRGTAHLKDHWAPDPALFPTYP